MSLNLFFLAIAAGLVSIFVFFRPMDIEKSQQKEIALLDLHQFTVYELGQGGLQSIMKGSSGERFEKRYEVRDANFTDNTRPYIQNMQSDFALYDSQKIYLEQHVKYERADGLTFRSNEATYHQVKGIATTKGEFVIDQGADQVHGRALRYNTQTGVIKAKQIRATFTLNNRKDNH